MACKSCKKNLTFTTDAYKTLRVQCPSKCTSASWEVVAYTLGMKVATPKVEKQFNSSLERFRSAVTFVTHPQRRLVDSYASIAGAAGATPSTSGPIVSSHATGSTTSLASTQPPPPVSHDVVGVRSQSTDSDTNAGASSGVPQTVTPAVATCVPTGVVQSLGSVPDASRDQPALSSDSATLEQGATSESLNVTVASTAPTVSPTQATDLCNEEDEMNVDDALFNFSNTPNASNDESSKRVSANAGDEPFQFEPATAIAPFKATARRNRKDADPTPTVVFPYASSKRPRNDIPELDDSTVTKAVLLSENDVLRRALEDVNRRFTSEKQAWEKRQVDYEVSLAKVRSELEEVTYECACLQQDLKEARQLNADAEVVNQHAVQTQVVGTPVSGTTERGAVFTQAVSASGSGAATRGQDPSRSSSDGNCGQAVRAGGKASAPIDLTVERGIEKQKAVVPTVNTKSKHKKKGKGKAQAGFYLSDRLEAKAAKDVRVQKATPIHPLPQNPVATRSEPRFGSVSLRVLKVTETKRAPKYNKDVELELVHVSGIQRMPLGTLREHLKRGCFDVQSILNISPITRETTEFLVKKSYVETFKKGMAYEFRVRKDYHPARPLNPKADKKMRQKFLNGFLNRVKTIIKHSKIPAVSEFYTKLANKYNEQIQAELNRDTSAATPRTANPEAAERDTLPSEDNSNELSSQMSTARALQILRENLDESVMNEDDMDTDEQRPPALDVETETCPTTLH